MTGEHDNAKGNGSDTTPAVFTKVNQEASNVSTPSQLPNHTMRMMGQPHVLISKGEVYARKRKEIWLESIRKNGWEGLLFADFQKLQQPKEDHEHLGISSQYWRRNHAVVPTSSTAFTELESHLASGEPAGFCTLSDYLPHSSVLTQIMCTTAAVLEQVPISEAGEENSLKLTLSVPQLLTASAGGFSYKYLNDEDIPAYRCFLFMGTEFGETVPPEDFDTNDKPEYLHAFVACADGQSLRKFETQTVMTMTALYKEGHTKFRMFTGDIVIIKGGLPFAVDLPVMSRMVEPRMLSWALFPHGKSGFFFRRSLNPPDIVRWIEEIIGTNEEAMSFYNEEMSNISNTVHEDKDHGDVENYMERLRVTPRLYVLDSIKSRINTSNSIYNVHEWFQA